MKRAVLADVLIGAALALAAGLYLAFTVAWKQPPYEDAAMLLRYAVHVADGHGMVWNIGDPPLDGATDLLFTLAVAAVTHLGVPVHAAARLLGVAAQLLTLFLVYFVPRRLYRAPAIACALGPLFMALGPGRSYISAEFGTTFFAMWAAIAWAVALIAAETRSRWADTSLPVVAVLLGMARPEGAILGAIMLLSVAIYRGGADGRRLLIRATLTFAVLGAVYFAARWRYFGHPLPNPFYIKGGGRLFVPSLRESVGNLTRLVGPFLPLLVLGLYSRETTARLVLVLIPVALFIGMWILLSNEMNFNMRFQYAVTPIVLMSWPGVFAPLAQQWRGVWRAQPARVRAAVLLAVAFTAVLVGIRQHFRTGPSDGPIDSLKVIGERLAGFRSRDYTLVVSEAGLLPLYSGWRSIDAWGLNDAEIAQSGGVTSEYLDRSHPAVISFHAYFSALAPPPPAGPQRQNFPRWDRMTMTLYDYANARGYRLAACFGASPNETNFYYVRPDLPDARDIIQAIRSTPYIVDGQPANDYATVATP